MNILTWRRQPCHEIHLRCPVCGNAMHRKGGEMFPRLCNQPVARRGRRVPCNTPYVAQEHEHIAGVCVQNRSLDTRRYLEQLDPSTWRTSELMREEVAP